jgi:hypothetical protein
MAFAPNHPPKALLAIGKAIAQNYLPLSINKQMEPKLVA